MTAFDITEDFQKARSNLINGLRLKEPDTSKFALPRTTSFSSISIDLFFSTRGHSIKGILKDGKKMKKIISLLIVLVISFVMVPEASSGKTEQWGVIVDGGQGSGNCTLIEEQDGTVTADGDWVYTYQGADFSGSYSDAPVTIAGSSIWITVSGTATNPYAPPGYQTSPFTVFISGTAYNGHGSGTFAITFTTFGWPPSYSGSWVATRTSGSGITAELAAPTVDFTADPVSGPIPLGVNFTVQFTGDITLWQWDFGDDSTSTEQNPYHTYTEPETYTVSLTVTGPGGSDTETKTDYIEVNHAAKAIPWIPLLLLDN